MKKLIRQAVHRMGFELHRLSPRSNISHQLLKALERFKINQVFDVGANTGRFASELRSVGYKEQIISFEPLQEAHRLLSKSAVRDSSWLVHRRVAVGDYDGETEINVAGNSVSSSILPMMKTHSSTAVDSAYIDTEVVPIVRLDSVAPEYLSESSRVFIKIDTQGFEWKVLDGASSILRDAKGVLCELSLIPLYEGQRLWKEMIKRLELEGFTLWYIQPGFTDPRDGRTLQVDAAFFRVDDE